MGNKLTRLKGMRALVAAALLFAFHTATAGVVVIGNPDLPTNSLTSSQVSDIFLGKKTSLPGGTKVTVIEHQDGEAVKNEFYQKVVGKNPNQLKAYWAKQIFTAEGFPPKAYAGDKAVKDQVSSTPGAIGYVDSGSVDSSVKVLFEAK